MAVPPNHPKVDQFRSFLGHTHGFGNSQKKKTSTSLGFDVPGRGTHSFSRLNRAHTPVPANNSAPRKMGQSSAGAGHWLA